MPGSSPESRPHELRLQTSTAGSTATVRCSGRLTAEVAAQLKNEVKRLIPQAKRIVLDLTDLAYMDSAGLGMLVGVYVSAKTAGCELQIIHLSKRVRELLGMTHLLDVFESCGQYFTKMP
jgi:anti-sigma B factor antagonist